MALAGSMAGIIWMELFELGATGAAAVVITDVTAEALSEAEIAGSTVS